MKMRNGFVSNSSTSSFVIVGYKNAIDMESVLEALMNESPEFAAKINEVDEYDDSYEILMEAKRVFGLDFVRDGENNDLYIGKLLCYWSGANCEELDNFEFNIIDVLPEIIEKAFKIGIKGDAGIYGATILS